jgi:hypothetical protein
MGFSAASNGENGFGSADSIDSDLLSRETLFLAAGVAPAEAAAGCPLDLHLNCRIYLFSQANAFCFS